MQQSEPLTFEQFIELAKFGMPRHANLYLYFFKKENPITQQLRETKHFMAYRAQFSTEEKELSDVVTNAVLNKGEQGVFSALRPVERDLYQKGYLLLRNFVESDDALF
ncbi:hypothetical protein HYU13_03075 [Candidatus Woesearchaeota archaeon]|nr:hypothetical protein [Candidatus Woesearchaeota archaeon]